MPHRVFACDVNKYEYDQEDVNIVRKIGEASSGGYY